MARLALLHRREADDPPDPPVIGGGGGSERSVELVGADGTRHTILCGDIYQVGKDPGFWGLTGRTYTSRRVANIPGERLRNVHTEPRTFGIPILIQGSEQEIDERLGALGRILNADGDIRIIYTRPDGTQREISARCLNADRVIVEHYQASKATANLVFRAFFPFWRNVTADDSLVSGGFVDYRTNSGINEVDVTNGGDVDTWPEITVNGYAENIEAVNLNTGQIWRIRRIIAAGEVVRLDTDPDHGSAVWLNDELDYRTVMSPSVAEFWPLVPGLNRLLIRAAGPPGGGAIGSYSIRWTERFDTC